MIPVPHYQLIEFLDFLLKNEPNLNIRGADNRMLRNYALQYIRGERGEVNFNNYSVLNLFQICPKISERTVFEQMKHFSRCGQCIEFIIQEQVNTTSVQLHPFLDGFREFARRKEIPLILEGVEPTEPRRRIPSDYILRKYLDRYGEQLFEAFNEYVEQTPPQLIRDYEQYHSEKLEYERSHNRERNRAGNRGWRDDRADNNTQPINPEYNPEQEAERLVNSVSLLIQGGFYDKYIEKQPEVLRLLVRANIISPHSLQALEFMSWLQENHPKLDILANAPTTEVKELALEFCEMNGYKNSASFSKEVVQWLNGKGDSNILQRLIDIGRTIKGKSGYSSRRTSPFERYKNINFHAVFLFLSAGDFPKFIKTYWEDLNFLTGDYIDIYYSDDDAERKISAFQTKDDFRSIRIQPMSLPALILWQDSLKDACVISLEHLSHDDIFDLLKLIVQNIQSSNSLLEIHQKSVEFVQIKTKALQPAYQLYFSGDNIMGDKLDFSNSNITNNGGQMFLGKFQDVIANLNASGKQEFGNALTNVKNEIEKSDKLSETEKQEVLEMVHQIGAEAAKSKPNKPILQALGDGLLKALKAIPDLVKVVGVLIALLPK